jgi:GH25 family lysozyme M1 (1,4-beta-N-acetylmuramidase)
MIKWRRVTVLRVGRAGRAGLAAAVAVALSATGAVDARAAVSGAAEPAVTTVARAGKPVRGLDISSYQHTGKAPAIDWQKLARDGIRFAAIKASEGDYYRNPYYASDVRNASNAGMAVLPYVFANPAKAGGKATAAYALKVVGSGHGREPVVIDLEDDPYAKHAACYGRRGKRIVKWIAGFVSKVHQTTGRFPVIYTTASWWRACTGGSRQFGKDPLWLAAYGGGAPALPSSWHQWAFWQYADNGKLAGLGPVDLDYYHPTDGLPALDPKKKSKPKRK